MRPLHRLVPLFAALSLAACQAHTNPNAATLRAAQQWQGAQRTAPLIADAYLQSLIALAEDDPWVAAGAREQAFAVARDCGLLPLPRATCAPCQPARTDQEMPGHLACLANRLRCLQP